MEPRSRSQTRSIRWSYWSWRFSTPPRLTCRNMCTGWACESRGSSARLTKWDILYSVMTGFVNKPSTISWIALPDSFVYEPAWPGIGASPPAVWAFCRTPVQMSQTKLSTCTMSENRPIVKLISQTAGLFDAAAATAARTVTFRLSLWTKECNICCVIACNLSIIACLFSLDRSSPFYSLHFLQRRFFQKACVIVYNYFKAQLSNLQ